MSQLLPIIADCDGCGACCLLLATPPFLDDELVYLSDDLLAEIEAAEAEHATNVKASRPCVWLDEETRQCKHYDERPYICREFERGGPECRRLRQEQTIDGADL